MNRAVKVFGIFAFIAIMVFALRAARPRPGRGADWASIKTTLDSAITNPIAFGKTHFTGGIGIMVGTDPAAGLPLIAGVAGGSPAEKAGLRVGDIIIKVNDVATSGQSQAKILESIRGYGEKFPKVVDGGVSKEGILRG